MTPNVAGVRDYTPSDGFNRTWSATARLGRLMVEEFDQDPTADVWIVLDLHDIPHRPATRPVNWILDDRGRWPAEAWLDSTEEYAVTVAASLAADSWRRVATSGSSPPRAPGDDFRGPL